MTQADDLGRVVIPKEIRRTLRLREGTPLEIFTDREGEIILKKYSPMMELNAFAAQYADAMAQSTGLMICITDRDQVIAAAGGARKELLQKPISKQLENVIQERMTVQAGKDDRHTRRWQWRTWRVSLPRLWPRLSVRETPLGRSLS